MLYSYNVTIDIGLLVIRILLLSLVDISVDIVLLVIRMCLSCIVTYKMSKMMFT